MSELKPTFDFSKVSRQWSKTMAASIQKATRAQIALQRPAPTNGDAAAMQKYYDSVDEALDVLEGLSDEQAELVSQVLVNVPREWLIEGSPEMINWHDMRSFDFIQEAYYAEILTMIQTGEARKLVEAKQSAKN